MSSTSPECALIVAEFISRVVDSWRHEHFSRSAKAQQQSRRGATTDESQRLSGKMFLALFYAAHGCGSGEASSETKHVR